MANCIISPALLLILIHNQSSRAALWTGYAWGIGQFATGISWVHISIDKFGGMPKIASLFLDVTPRRLSCGLFRSSLGHETAILGVIIEFVFFSPLQPYGYAVIG